MLFLGAAPSGRPIYQTLTSSPPRGRVPYRSPGLADSPGSSKDLITAHCPSLRGVARINIALNRTLRPTPQRDTARGKLRPIDVLTPSSVSFPFGSKFQNLFSEGVSRFSRAFSDRGGLDAGEGEEEREMERERETERASKRGSKRARR